MNTAQIASTIPATLPFATSGPYAHDYTAYAAALDWRAALAAERLRLCQLASPEVRLAWVVAVTHRRVHRATARDHWHSGVRSAQVVTAPDAFDPLDQLGLPPEGDIAQIRQALLAWRGDRAEIDRIRDLAWAVYFDAPRDEARQTAQSAARYVYDFSVYAADQCAADAAAAPTRTQESCVRDTELRHQPLEVLWDLEHGYMLEDLRDLERLMA